VITAAPKATEPPPTFTTPPPEPPKPVVVPDTDAARGAYANLLGREFAKHKQYPRLAQMRGWQGTVTVQLQIDASGTVTSSNISQSSGFEVLDKQALEMVKKASPLPQPPEALRDHEFTIHVPVVFRLE
jgi:protein TonB